PEPESAPAAGSADQDREPKPEPASSYRPPRPPRNRERPPSPIPSPDGPSPAVGWEELDQRVDAAVAAHLPPEPALPHGTDGHADEAPAEPGEPGDLPGHDRTPARIGRRSTADTYLALAWLESLLDDAPGQAAYLYLDHYHEIGWLDEADHRWLCSLVDGVATRAPESPTWDDLGVGPVQLLRTHRRNLRFLDHLAGRSLAPGESDHLEDRVRRLLEEG
ncbi:MAG: FlaD/FlaE family flagellar protein, partial [Thermoplasmatota archaeon]